MLNLRYIFRLVKAFVSRFKVLIILSAAVGIAVFFLLKVMLPLLAGSSVTRIGLTGRYNTNNLPPQILSMISDGLTKLDKSGNVEPGLAASWDTPDKGKTWTFTLKDNVMWQDGKKVVASGITYQFTDVTVERPNDKTLTFKLQNPYSAFPSVVSRPVFRKGLLGTGSWEVKNLSLSGSYVDQITLQKKTGQKIIYKFYPTEERAKLAFELGEVDELQDLIVPSPFDTWKNLNITNNVNTGEFVAVFFNSQNKLLGEKTIRQALSYAINKEALGGKRAISPISVDSWAYNSQVKPYNYDPEKAKGVIDDYKKNAKVTEVEINLTTPPILLAEAEQIKKDWEAIGLKVNLQVFSNVPGDYQALLAIFDIPDDPDQYSIWHSTQTVTNITHYQNPRIDKLLEDGRSEINTEDRKKTYLDFQRFLVEDSPAAFLYYPDNYTIKRK